METPHDVAAAVVWTRFALNPSDADLVIHQLGSASEPVVASSDLPTRIHQANLSRRLSATPEDVRALWLGTALLFRQKVGTPATEDSAFSSFDQGVQ